MNILANHAEMASLASRVHTAAEAADQEVESTRAQLSTLQDSFQGSTAVAFDERYTEWDTAAKDLTTALRDLGRWLRAASETLQAHDESGASSLRA